mmetsp:Transcript_32961/g.51098  ORF Transcript_32961/g.51098 Transcript_32961/m.51098 type:complete len:420 (-) Transcript_32961:34-1293(-)
MDLLASRAVTFNSKQSDYGSLLSLFDLQDTTQTLRNNIQQIDQILNQIDPNTQTMTFALFLNGKVIHGGVNEPEIFISQVDRLFTNPNQIQIQRVTASVRNICECYSQVHINRGTPAAGIKTLQVAILKTRKSPEQLTPVHAQFVKLCLKAKCYHLALPLLEQDIFEVDPKGTKTSDFMTYFYYGGMVYIGSKDFSRAIHFFKLAITIPASIGSSIMVESFKKLVMVSLIHYGTVPPFPPEIEGIVVRQIKNACALYIQCGETYANNDISKFKQFCEENQESFAQDRNLGLLMQVCESLYEKLILRFTKCFITLSLHDIAKGVQLESADIAEKYMLRMIEQGKICATINLQDGMVNFEESSHSYSGEQTAELHKQIQKSIGLSRRLDGLRKEMKQSNEYAQKKAHQAQHKTPSGPGSFF